MDKPPAMPEQSAGQSLRLLILGAHPDDGEYHAGGLAVRYRMAGHRVRIVSVTHGGAGHHRLRTEDLIAIRRSEAASAAEFIGAESVVWDFPDGSLLPTLALRERIITEIRTFRPDLLLTHRPNDYHPDHRAVGQAVQDASFLVTVPLVVPDVPALRRDPVVASMVDLFTRPCPFRPDVVLDVSNQLARIVEMLACHRSQFFEWLPYNACAEDQVPSGTAARLSWLRTTFVQRVTARKERFLAELIEKYGHEHAHRIEICEAYEISEYASRADEATVRMLFEP